MEIAKRYWAQAHAQLAELNRSQRWLIGALLALGVLVVWVLVRAMSGPDLVPITAFAGTVSNTPQMIARLQGAGIDVTQEGGQVLVPESQQSRAIAVLVEGDLLSGNAADAFDDYIKSSQQMFLSNAQSRQRFGLARERALGDILRRMKGVRSADVVISLPESTGFGRTHIRPSASVTIRMQGGQRVERPLVEAVAGLVSGAVAELKPPDVVVIDADQGRQHTVQDPEESVPTDVIEMVRNQENYYRDKIASVLGYIDGAIVAVNVRTDDTHREVVRALAYEDTEPIQSEETEEQVDRTTQAGGEPGVRPNVGISIDDTRGPTRESTTTSERRTFGAKNLVEQRDTVRAGHSIEQINVTVGVPRGYFVRIWSAANPDAKETPGDAALQPLIDAQLAQIEDQVRPQIAARTPGDISVSMVPDLYLRSPADDADAAGGVGMWVGDWGGSAVVAMLSLASLGAMFYLIRSATRRDPEPSIDELVGIPPALAGAGAGGGAGGGGGSRDAGGVDPDMPGLAVDEATLKARKIAEQISDLVRANPAEAGSVLSRWVRGDE